MRAKKQLKNENLYVAYYRVSTDKQGERGLGIQAQRAEVDRFMASHPEAVLYACFTEVESGTKKGKRPGVHEALALTKQIGATLLIAKHDRLSRSVRFICELYDEKVPFIALNMPWANKHMIQQMALFAEWEADMISERTKAGLAVRIANGGKCGNPQNLVPKYSHLDRSEAAAARRTDATQFAQKMYPDIKRYLQHKYSLNKIASEFNRLEYKTASGLVGSWTARAVKNCLDWVEAA